MKISIPVICLLSLVFSGCGKEHAATESSAGGPVTARAKIDVCQLLKGEEIQEVQKSAVTETHPSEQSGNGMRVGQCYFGAQPSNRSVSLTVTQADPDSSAKRSAREFWKQTFGSYEHEEKERDGDKEKKESLREQSREGGQEEKSVPPKKIAGIGDEAFWSGNRVGGALYVLKNDVFIRISLGGPDDEQTRIDKSKALAQKALERL